MPTKKLHKEIAQDFDKAHPYLGREGLVYVRVSSKKQELEGHGRESQEQRCKQDLDSISVPCVRSFPDTYSGHGDFMGRPAMRDLLAYVDAHPHKKYVVVFDDLKRFARDTTFHLKLRKEFKVRNIIPRCLNYNFDDSPEGMFVETILAAGNELERHQNQRQVVQKMRARLELGYWPFAGKRGYNTVKQPLHGKIHVANKDGKGVLREALEGFASGRFRQQVEVALFMYEEGFWKKPKRRPEAYSNQVAVILRDVFHAGYIEYPKWDVTRRQGNHEGLISLATYDLIQKRLRGESSNSRIRLDLSPEFPLRGLVVCPECNEKLTAGISRNHKKQPYAYYYCYSRECGLHSKGIQKKKLEGDFEALLLRNRLRNDMDALVKEIFDNVWKQEVKTYHRQTSERETARAGMREKLRELTEMARTTTSDVVRRTYEQEIEEVAQELESKKSGENRDPGVPYRTALSKVSGLLKNPAKVWESVDVVEKQKLYFFLFEGKLAYTRNEGFRTGNSLSTTRLFEEFSEEDSLDVVPTSLY